MTPWSERLHRAEGIAATLLLALAASSLAACVSSGRYRETAGERDALREENAHLQQEVQRLRASNESLGAERVRIIDEMESLRIARDKLDLDVGRLQRFEAELSSRLEARESELEATSEEVVLLRGTYQALVDDLESEVASGQIRIEQLKEGIRVNIAQEVLFASGSAQLDAVGREVLLKVAAKLAELNYHIEIEGHSDDRPPSARLAKRYPTNWELAGARAGSVARLFLEAGIDGQRVTASSFAEYQPVVSNDTPEGRALNRRIEIRLRPGHEASEEEGVAPASP